MAVPPPVLLPPAPASAPACALTCDWYASYSFSLPLMGVSSETL